MINWFLNLPRFHKRAISVSSDILVLSFAIWAAFALRLEQGVWLPTRGHLIVAGITVLITIVVFVRLGLYRAVIRFFGRQGIFNHCLWCGGVLPGSYCSGVHVASVCAQVRACHIRRFGLYIC